MPAGAVFVRGQPMVRPGVYIAITNIGEVGNPLAIGIAGALFRSNWGPLGQVSYLTSTEDADNTYWLQPGQAGNTVDLLREIFRGGALNVVAARMGSGGAAASITLMDTTATTPVPIATVTGKWPGIRSNNFTVSVRDSLTDSTKRELLVYETIQTTVPGQVAPTSQTRLLQTITFTKGIGPPNEIASLIAAATGSPWVNITSTATGSGIFAPVTQVAMIGGLDPTITTADVSTALSLIENEDFNILVTDLSDQPTAATLQAYTDRLRNYGKRIMSVIAEPSVGTGAVPWGTRMSDVLVYNDPAVIYVANGFNDSFGNVIDGYRAGGRVTGMILGTPQWMSITQGPVQYATSLTEKLTDGQIQQAINNGAIVFTLNARRQVVVEYGITTFRIATPDLDLGWRKIRRVQERDGLLMEIAAEWQSRIGRTSNTPDGRASLVAAANTIIRRRVVQGILIGAQVLEDPAFPATGDSAYFILNADDPDGAEHIYITAGFRVAAPVATGALVSR